MLQRCLFRMSAGLALLLALLALAPRAGAADAQVLELRSGTVSSTIDGLTRTETAELPYDWDRHHGGQSGRAAFELDFTLPATPAAPWGIFLPRVGNSFELLVNGALLQVSGNLERGNAADYAKAPLFVALPSQLLRVGDNRLTIRIRADSGRRAGLEPPVIGPAARVRGSAHFASAYAWRFSGSVLLCAFSILVGGIALALWLTQVDAGAGGGQHREGVYLWAALAEFCWALRVADPLIPQPPLPWPMWGTLMAACFSGCAASAVMFCHHIAGWHRYPSYRWVRWVVAGASTLPPVVTWLVLTRARPDWLKLWLAADAYGDADGLRYASVFFGLAVLGILIARFRAASAQARELLGTLASRLAQREEELAATYRQLELAAREQARTQERERILADMHDGVGAHLSAAIRQLQSGQTEPDELLVLLRDSLDQLKLSIDSIRLPPGDVGALLAALRHRLEPRFAALGLALEWAVDELPPLARLDDQAMRLLQYLLFEAISNVLQHAHASVLRVEAAMRGAVLHLALADNGRGYDAARPPRALAERARALGARLAVESRPGRTVVQLEIDAV